MKLSEAILKGCEMFPQQGNGEFFGPRHDQACVIGAAIAATLGREDAQERLVPFSDTAQETYPVLRRLAEDFGLDDPCHEMPVGNWIVRANDDGIPRERIAAILAEKGL